MTPQEKQAQGRALGEALDSNQAQPTVSANDLANPVPTVNPPVDQAPEPSGRVGSLVGNVQRDTQGFIVNQSEEAQRAREIADQMASVTGGSADFRADLNTQYGIPENLKTLQDIQLQLADNQTGSQLTKARIAAAPGQTVGQAGRELTQEDREQAVRDAGLAARAAVLQGNIETASTLVSQAVQDYNADRTFNNQQMINQLNYFQGVADEQTGQLLEQEKRKYEEDQAQITRAQNLVDTAVSSGFASAADMKKITELSSDPQAQAQFSLSIVANAAREAAYLDRLAQEASIAASNRSGAESDLKRRQALYELAELGDPQAVEELGWDPTIPLSDEENKVIDKQIESINEKISQATEALGNKMGLRASSGEWQTGEATIKGFLGEAGEGLVEQEDGTMAFQPTQYGGLSGMAKARQDKSTFLAQMDNLITQEGLAEIGRLAERGIKLTPITEKELAILMTSASTLNAAAIRGVEGQESGKLLGFGIPDYQVEEETSKVILALTNLRAELQANKNLPRGTYGELETIYQENVANGQ